MKLYVIAIFSMVWAVGGCGSDQADVAGALGELDSKLERIDKRLARLEDAGRAAQGTARPARPQRPRPEPGVVYSIPIDDAPFKGNPDAPVTVVEVMEFACPYCERARPLADQVLARYGDRVKVAYKTYLVHPDRAGPAALAACAADEQGKFAELEALIWERGFKAGKLDAGHIASLAGEAGLDMDRYAADVNGVCPGRIQRDIKQMTAIGATGTPTFFVNGRVLPRRSLADLEKMIEEAEAEARSRLGADGAADTYYATWVVEKGKRTL